MTTSRVRRGTKRGTIILEIEMGVQEFSKLTTRAERNNGSVADLVLTAYESIEPDLTPRKVRGARNIPTSRVATPRNERRDAIRERLALNESAASIAAALGMTSAGVYYHKNEILREEALAKAAPSTYRSDTQVNAIVRAGLARGELLSTIAKAAGISYRRASQHKQHKQD